METTEFRRSIVRHSVHPSVRPCIRPSSSPFFTFSFTLPFPSHAQPLLPFPFVLAPPSPSSHSSSRASSSFVRSCSSPSRASSSPLAELQIVRGHRQLTLTHAFWASFGALTCSSRRPGAVSSARNDEPFDGRQSQGASHGAQPQDHLLLLPIWTKSSSFGSEAICALCVPRI